MSTQLEKNIIRGILLCIQILNPIPKALGTTLSSKKALIFWRTALNMLVANPNSKPLNRLASLFLIVYRKRMVYLIIKNKTL